MNLKSLLNINQALKETFFRFIFVYVFIIFAVILSILDNHHIHLLNTHKDTKLIFISVLSIIGVASVKLYIESLKKNVWTNIFLSVMIVAFSFYAIWYFNTSKIFLILAVILSITFSPFIFKENSRQDFLNFNFESFNAVVFGLVASTILYLGLVAIYASVGYLFEFKVPSKLYTDTLIVVYIGIFSILVLSKLSKELSFSEENTIFNKTLAFLINYIFVPLLYVYLVILYLYFIKIALQQELPKGNLSWMVLTFASIGTFVYISSYKVKDNINKFAELFRKYFYFSLVIPIAVLYLAIYVRIDMYGITEARYAVVMLAVWLSYITLLAMIKQDFNFKWIVISLTFLGLIASVTPFNASIVSANSQLKRFFTILKEKNLFVDEKITTKNVELTRETEEQIISIVSYLSKNEYALKKLEKYFVDIKPDENETRYIISGNILKKLNIEQYGYPTKLPIKLEGIENVPIQAKGADYVVHHCCYYDSKITYILEDKKKKSINVLFKDDILTFEMDNEKLSFNISKHIKSLADQGVKKITVENIELLRLKGKFKNSGITFSFVPTQINPSYKKKNLISNVGGYLFLKNEKN
jgi:hypothetical protein